MHTHCCLSASKKESIVEKVIFCNLIDKNVIFMESKCICQTSL